jgi:hypothetical protein
MAGGSARRLLDDYIAQELQLSGRQQASRATRLLAATDYFYRDLGLCSICGIQKRIITAL